MNTRHSGNDDSFSTASLLEKIAFIRAEVDENFRLVLNSDWSSTFSDYRLRIRRALEEKMTQHFTREQLVLLNDLNWLPESNSGYFSISHCKSMGGFTFSTYRHGFDVEELSRISVSTLVRTSSDFERSTCPRTEFLWVAKEAGVKALSGAHGYERPEQQLVVTHLRTYDWNSHFENKIFSFRMKSEKALEFNLNKGFIFLEGDKLFCCYFR
jgi:hypothetical protein